VNSKVLDALGREGYVCNIARGSVIDEQALLRYLQDKKIAGAGLDVFVDEPHVPPALFELDNVTLQAHRASATVETRTAMGEMVLASLAQALAGERPAHSLTT
jgi:lactate dehydrogenase-like 2-hydroxyacid dehydrogenase